MPYTNSHASNAHSQIRWAFFINLSFTCLEIAGAFWTHSLAILSDALHDLGDSLAIGIAWILEKHAHKKKIKGYTYGLRRLSLLSAFINTIILIVGSIFILLRAIPRLFNPEAVHAPGMLLFAIAGILVNGIAALKLRNQTTYNARIVTWHLFEDVLGWAAVLIVSIILLIWDIPILDPLLSITITLYIAYHMFQHIRKIGRLFLQAIPADIDMNHLEKILLDHDQIQELHDIHLWSLDGENHILSIHVVVGETIEQKGIIELKSWIRQQSEKMNIEHVTIEIEYYFEECDYNEKIF